MPRLFWELTEMFTKCFACYLAYSKCSIDGNYCCAHELICHSPVYTAKHTLMCPGISGRRSSCQIFLKIPRSLQITSGSKKVPHLIPSQKVNPKILMQKTPSFSLKTYAFHSFSLLFPLLFLSFFHFASSHLFRT